MVWAVGATKYIGLWTPAIVEVLLKLLLTLDFAEMLGFTAATLGAGSKGGKMIPLSYIGVMLGNSLYISPLPSSLLSGMEIVAVFAEAATTPLASTFMTIKLFSDKAVVFAGIVCASIEVKFAMRTYSISEVLTVAVISQLRF